MNILFSSDDNYARHLGVAMYSLLWHNKQTEIIRLFVVDNNISPDNKEKIIKVVSEFDNAELSFISFKQWADQLHLNMAWPISLSSYARLFVGEMLPEDVDRVVYLDCDIVVNGDLNDLWKTYLADKVLGAVQDQVSNNVKTSIGIGVSDPYFNAGMLLIDLINWRNNDFGKQCLSFINSHDGGVIHHDQGVLNGLLKDLWLKLPLKYNVMTIHYMLPYNKIRNFYMDESPFYDSQEINKAKENPIIIHYTPSFTSHPWEKHCKHPYSYIYHGFLNKTPWKGYKLEREKTPWYVIMINWYYRMIY